MTLANPNPSPSPNPNPYPNRNPNRNRNRSPNRNRNRNRNPNPNQADELTQRVQKGHLVLADEMAEVPSYPTPTPNLPQT